VGTVGRGCKEVGTYLPSHSTHSHGTSYISCRAQYETHGRPTLIKKLVFFLFFFF
jgi:hypothetical protein